MSTNINITVGDKALLDRAKQQQSANRQAQLNREASTRLEAQATAARTTALATQGRDANGNLITGAPFTQPRIDRRPAANRSGLGVLLVPSQGYTEYNGTLTGLRGRSKGVRSPVFSRFDYADSTEYPWGRNYPEATYLPTGGPQGTGALEVNPSNPIVGVVNYRPMEYVSGDVFPIPGEQFYYGNSYGPDPYKHPSTPTSAVMKGMQSLVYALTSNQYDTVLEWQQSISPAPLPPYQLLDPEGLLVDATPALKWLNMPRFTQECFFRCGTNLLEPGKLYRSFNSKIIVQRFMRLRIFSAGVTITLLVAEDYDAGNTWVINDSLTGVNRIIRDWTVRPSYTVTCDVQSSTALNPSFGVSLSVPNIGDGQWLHVAMVKDQIDGISQWFFYCQGKRIGLNPWIEQDEWANTYGQQPVSARIEITSYQGPASPPEPLIPAIHGYRFTPKALYKNEFTPPLNITNFA